VEYYNRIKYVLFKCDWTDNTRGRGYKLDKHDLTLVNFKNLVHGGIKLLMSPMCYLPKSHKYLTSMMIGPRLGLCRDDQT
jgi:hypothetical protein